MNSTMIPIMKPVMDEAEADAAFELAGGEDAGHEVSGDAKGFDARPERTFGATDVGDCDEAGGCVGEGCHDAGEIAGRDEDVAVVDDDEVVGGVGQHLREVGDLAVGAEALGALDQLDGDGGVLDAEAGDLRDGVVCERADAEDNLEVAGVLLETVADEA